MPNVCIAHYTCNVDEGTVNLFDWLRFLGKTTLTQKQRRLEASAQAWLTKFFA